MVNKAIEPRLAILFQRGMCFRVFFNETKAEFCSKGDLGSGKTFLSTHDTTSIRKRRASSVYCSISIVIKTRVCTRYHFIVLSGTAPARSHCYWKELLSSVFGKKSHGNIRRGLFPVCFSLELIKKELGLFFSLLYLPLKTSSIASATTRFSAHWARESTLALLMR